MTGVESGIIREILEKDLNMAERNNRVVKRKWHITQVKKKKERK